ncbi:MAG TPA: S41 family peptidase [Bryobacteraceae bacterium]|nr:S41 family peptidase [Bryobacteraceae bacterium]
MVRIRFFVPVLLAGLCCPAVLLGPALGRSAAAAPESELRQSLESFARAYAVVEQNFAEPVPPDQSIYNGAIQGMLRTLDPHSNFLDPKTYQLLQQDQRGQYYGVGMEISMDGPVVIVTQPFPGSPAARAGVRRGDSVVEIDGENVKGLNSAQVADKLKGPRGTQVQLAVAREGVEKPLPFTITRDAISRSDVDAFWLRPGVAYLRVRSFTNQNTGQEVEDRFKELGEDKIEGLILDLRDNGGGLVSESVTVAGRFLKKGQTVVSHRGRASAEQVFRAKGQAADRKYPIVVMVNRYSASAAEIVAGALQDHDRGWVMGESTFGKGLVQAQFPLSEGAALLLTIARYYTPSGRLIQRDYEHMSFFEYAYGRGESRNIKDEKHTDAGRTVYGGNGIAPDEKYENPKVTAFQRRAFGRFAFFHFANTYFGGRVPKLPENWKPDAEVMKQFQAFLVRRGIEFTPAEFEQNRKWVEEQLRLEMYTRAFDRKRAEQAQVEDDPQVHKAVGSLPTAQALLAQVRLATAK